MQRLIRVHSVIPLNMPFVRVVFTNGEHRDINLSSYINRGPLFAAIRNDPNFFRTVYVEGGTIAWPNGADIDPDVLYYEGAPPWVSEDSLSNIEHGQ